MPPGAAKEPNAQITTSHPLIAELNRADRGCGVPFRVLVRFLQETEAQCAAMREALFQSLSGF